MIDALMKSGGLVHVAARVLGCAHTTLYARIKTSKAVAKALEEARNQNLDIAEAKLLELIRKGNVPSVIFYLKTVGKHRGYVERQEISVLDRPEYVEACRQLGTTPEQEFEALMQAIAQKAQEVKAAE